MVRKVVRDKETSAESAESVTGQCACGVSSLPVCMSVMCGCDRPPTCLSTLVLVNTA